MGFTPKSAATIRLMLQESAAEFENGVGELLGAEGKKLKFFLDNSRYFPTTSLVSTNNQIKDLACCLASLECCIVSKLKAASHI